MLKVYKANTENDLDRFINRSMQATLINTHFDWAFMRNQNEIEQATFPICFLCIPDPKIKTFTIELLN